MTEPTPQQHPSDTARATRGRWWLTCLYVLFVVVAVWAALRWGRQSDTTVPTLGSDGRYVAAPADAEPDALFGESFVDELELVDLDELPADLVMPPGAMARSIVAYRAGGDEQIKAEYVAPGDVATVGDTLGPLLEGLGWERIDSPYSLERPTDRDSMLYLKSGDTLSLHLNRDGVCVIIVAVIHRHGATDPDQR